MTIAPASREEWTKALELAFRHLPEDQRQTRCANTLAHLQAGDIPAEGFLLARGDEGIVGVLMCMPLKGASGLFWLPILQEGVPATVADELVRHGLDWLRAGGAKLAQAFVPAEEMALAAPLLRRGFRHVTRLHYMRHDLEEVPVAAARAPRLVFETYQPANQRVFHETLWRTYEGTLDCPELNGRRSIEEIVEGHRHQGKLRTDCWWLAFVRDRPVGVAIVTELFGWEGWDLSYVGVVPEERGRGVGRALTVRVLREARRARVTQVILAVDGRNDPARQLYKKLGFQDGESREILLFFFMDLAAKGEQDLS